MDTNGVKQVLEQVYYGEYETPEAARTDINGALEFVEAQLKELIELKQKLDSEKAMLIQQVTYLDKMRAAHKRAV